MTLSYKNWAPALAALCFGFNAAAQSPAAPESEAAENRWTQNDKIVNVEQGIKLSQALSQTAANDSATASYADEAAKMQEQQNFTPQSVERWSLTADPHIPVEAIGGLLGMALLLSLYAARKKTKGAALRAGAALTLAAVLYNPQILKEEHETLPTDVLIVVDKTDSQKLGDRTKNTDAAYEQLLGELSKVNGINIRTIDAKNIDSHKMVNGTRLFEALERGQFDMPKDRVGGVFMLTDGVIHDTPKPGGDGAAAPLHILLSGSESEYDREVLLKGAPRYGQVDEKQTLRFQLKDNGKGPAAKGPVKVNVRYEGKNLRSLDVTPGETVEVEVDLNHIGENLFEVVAEEWDGELTDANNRLVIPVEGIREALDVLLVSGQPNMGTRTWRDLMKADPNVNLVHFNILKTPEKAYTPLRELSLISFPTQELFMDKIKEFDLVIFDQYQMRGLIPHSYLQNVADYVKEGGSLLVVSGPELSQSNGLSATPLGEILPAKPVSESLEKAYVPTISELGQKHPVTRNLQSSNPASSQWGSWLRVVPTQAGGDASVVMTGADQNPLLVLDREGKGRVAMLNSDQSWLWAKNYQGGGPHAKLFSQVVHWLLKNPAFEEESLKLVQKDGKIIVEQSTVGETGSSIELTSPSGRTQTVTPKEVAPGIWRAEVPAAELGMYHARLANKTGISAFRNFGPDHPKEFETTISTPEILSPFAKATGGSVLRMVDGKGAANNFEIVASSDKNDLAGLKKDQLGIRLTDETVLKGINRVPLTQGWPGAVIMGLMLGVLAFAYAKESEIKVFSKETWKRKKTPRPDQ